MSILIIIEIDISYELWNEWDGNQHSTFCIWSLLFLEILILYVILYVNESFTKWLST